MRGARAPSTGRRRARWPAADRPGGGKSRPPRRSCRRSARTWRAPPRLDRRTTAPPATPRPLRACPRPGAEAARPRTDARWSGAAADARSPTPPGRAPRAAVRPRPCRRPASARGCPAPTGRAVPARAEKRRRGAIRDREVQRLSDAGPDVLGAGDRGQRDEVHPVREPLDDLSRDCATPSRVFPDPPGPVSVTSRTSLVHQRATRSATSERRPSSGVVAAGRLEIVPTDFSGGKSAVRRGSRAGAAARAGSGP